MDNLDKLRIIRILVPEVREAVLQEIHIKDTCFCVADFICQGCHESKLESNEAESEGLGTGNI
jgi:hypothetical protein